VSKSSARTATQLLKLRPYKTTVIQALQRSSSQCSFLQLFSTVCCLAWDRSALTYFSYEAWFHLQGYINTQNNRYWRSQNPHLTHEVLLHPVKVGVWCVISVRGNVVPVFFNEIIHFERYKRVEGQHFQHLLLSVNWNCFVPNVIGSQACWFNGIIRMRLATGAASVTMKRRAVEPVNE
jgi:hypothetical protein